MNPNTSMSSLGGSALAEAIQARGGGQTSGVTGLNQATPSAPVNQSTLPMQSSGQMPAMMRQQGMGGMQGMSGMGKPFDEKEIILRAFDSRLKAISKAEQVQTNLQAMPVI